MSYCYILFSAKLQCHYIGFTEVNPEVRLIKHNKHSYGDHHFTSKSDDWELCLCIHCESTTQALKIERHIKRMKSSTYIINLTRYPEMIEKLKRQYMDKI
jgi:putative endonuclease